MKHSPIFYEMPRKDKPIEKQNHVFWEGEWRAQLMKQEGTLWYDENDLQCSKIVKIIEFYTYNENIFDMLLCMSNTCIILRYHVHDTSIKLFKKKQKLVSVNSLQVSSRDFSDGRKDTPKWYVA